MDEGELAEEVKIPHEHQPFAQITQHHVRAIADFKPITAVLRSGVKLSITPVRVEAKLKEPGMPPHVTIEGETQTWELFWCDLKVLSATSRP